MLYKVTWDGKERKWQKKPVNKAWQKLENKPTRDQVKAALDNGQLLGWIPGLGIPPFLVVDLDKPEYRFALNPVFGARTYICKIPSVTKGRYHVVYASRKGLTGHGEWAGGEWFITGHGVVLHRPSALLEAFQTVPYSKAAKIPAKRLNALQRDLWPKGGRDITLNKLVYEAAANGGTDFSDLEATALRSGHEQSRVLKTIKSASKSGREAYSKKPAAKVPTGTLFEVYDEDTLLTALKVAGYEVRFNVVGQSPELASDDIWVRTDKEWAAASRGEMGILRNAIAKACQIKQPNNNHTYPYRPKGEHWRVDWDAVLGRHPYNPIEAYLADLPAWDGRPRIATLFQDTLDSPDPSRHLETTARGLITAAVARALKPLVKWDWVVILNGPGGVGKSTFVEQLCPNPDWYTSLTSLRARAGKDLIELVLGKWIVEISEMDYSGTKKEFLKAWISDTRDRARLAYQEHAMDYHRRSILIGTADRDDCLPDDENLRRWVVLRTAIKKGRIDWHKRITEYFNSNRAQVWAEGLYLYRNNDCQPIVYGPAFLKWSEDRAKKYTIVCLVAKMITILNGGKPHRGHFLIIGKFG